MKIVRILICEGDEDTLKKHLSQTFIAPDRPFERPNTARHCLTIREIFRGSMHAALVEHLDEGELLAEQELHEQQVRELDDSIPDLRLDEETAP